MSDAARYKQVREIEGASPVVWRQGIKHDCAVVMELQPENRGCGEAARGGERAREEIRAPPVHAIAQQAAEERAAGGDQPREVAVQELDDLVQFEFGEQLDSRIAHLLVVRHKSRPYQIV